MPVSAAIVRSRLARSRTFFNSAYFFKAAAAQGAFAGYLFRFEKWKDNMFVWTRRKSSHCSGRTGRFIIASFPPLQTLRFVSMCWIHSACMNANVCILCMTERLWKTLQLWWLIMWRHCVTHCCLLKIQYRCIAWLKIFYYLALVLNPALFINVFFYVAS